MTMKGGISQRVARRSLFGKGAFERTPERREEVGLEASGGKSVLLRGKGKCKGSEQN